MNRHEVAGGVVLNSEGKVLTIVRDVERNGKLVHEVRLPKGHIDPGETPEEAAIREVAEESGYHHVEIVADLGTTKSCYTFRGQDYERTEYYYIMRLTRDQRGAPAPTHAEEALFEPEWMSPEIAEMEMTYESEREFVRRTRKVLNA